MSAGAVFLDRDGTIIHDPGFVARPAQVRLLPGALSGLRRLARWGWRLVIVSNQSGIARGYYAAEAFHATMDRLHELLAPAGVRILAAYFCPHFPDITGPCACRKPGVRLFQRAARDFDIDLSESWYLGNNYRDAAPSLALGGRGLLLAGNQASDEARQARAAGIPLARDLGEAARLVGPPAPGR